MAKLSGSLEVKKLTGLVKLTAVAPGTDLQAKTVAPGAKVQTVTPDGGYAGLSQVTVQAAALQAKSVDLGANAQFVTPDSGYAGLSQVTVGAGPLQAKTVSPSTDAQTVEPDAGFYGLNSVELEAATKQYKFITPGEDPQTVEPDEEAYGLALVGVYGDANLVPANIKKGVTIFGVTGTYVPSTDSGDTGGGSGGTEDADLVDYNGVKLPAVWQYMDDTYKDAAILSTGGLYWLYVIGGTWSIEQSGDVVKTTVGSIHKLYTAQAGATAWTYHSSDFGTTFGCITLRNAVYTPIWATFEIPGLDTGGGDTGGGDTESIAYLYNGVQLPDINTVWTDELKAEYPYAHIIYYTNLGIYSLRCSQDPVSYTAYYELFEAQALVGLGKFLQYDAEGASWEFYKEDEILTAIGLTVSRVVWSSHDILNIDDGSIYLAASEPIPVYE